MHNAIIHFPKLVKTAKNVPPWLNGAPPGLENDSL